MTSAFRDQRYIHHFCNCVFDVESLNLSLLLPMCFTKERYLMSWHSYVTNLETIESVQQPFRAEKLINIEQCYVMYKIETTCNYSLRAIFYVGSNIATIIIIQFYPFKFLANHHNYLTIFYRRRTEFARQNIWSNLFKR